MVTAGEFFQVQYKFEESMKIGDLVHAHWSAGSGGHFDAVAKIAKINEQSIVVELEDDLKRNGKILYPKGHKINVPRVTNFRKWSGLENFQPIEKMADGGYVCRAYKIEVMKGNEKIAEQGEISCEPAPAPEPKMNEGGEMGEPFLYVVDMDEGNTFRAHVADVDGIQVFQVENERDEGENELVKEGHMKDNYDIDGLESHLKQMGIIKNNDWITEDENEIEEYKEKQQEENIHENLSGIPKDEMKEGGAMTHKEAVNLVAENLKQSGATVQMNEGGEAKLHAYPETIYKAYNSNFSTPISEEDIDRLDFSQVREKASSTMEGGKSMFDQLYCNYLDKKIDTASIEAINGYPEFIINEKVVEVFKNGGEMAIYPEDLQRMGFCTISGKTNSPLVFSAGKYELYRNNLLDRRLWVNEKKVEKANVN